MRVDIKVIPNAGDSPLSAFSFALSKARLTAPEHPPQDILGDQNKGR